MRYSEMLNIVGDDPVFETHLLAAGKVTAYQAQRRITDWAKAGKITSLRRGLFVLPKASRRYEPHPFVIANRLVAGSYISLEMALSYYGLIPEHVAVITCITTGRPSEYENEFGRFQYRHMQPRYFFGMEYRLIVEGQFAYLAYPEKALLDFIYLRKGGDSVEFIRSLRLQNLEQINLERLHRFANRFNKPRIHRAAENIVQLAETEAAEYELL